VGADVVLPTKLIEERNKSRNAVYIRRHPRGKAKTSARAIALVRRRKEALDYRTQGYSYANIGKEMDCHPSTAHSLVVRAMQNICPREKCEQVVKPVLIDDEVVAPQPRLVYDAEPVNGKKP
jgi:hypothetical protein